MKKILFPGSFDPLTNAHLEIIHRLLKMNFFVEVGIFVNSEKKPMYSSKERLEIIQKIIKNNKMKNVEVTIENELLIDVCQRKQINLVARGIRSIKDYEYEKEMEYNNKQLKNELDYIYLNASAEHNYVSSTIVRELIKYNASIVHLVPKEVIEVLEKRKNAKI